MEVLQGTGRYVGDVKRQLRDGFGLYIYPNSFYQYEGEWKNGKKHGIGKFLMKDGSYYEGEFANGEIEGNGIRYWASSGNEYCGQFSQGELHGFGVMKYFDGTRYEGEFHYGVRTGHGALIDKEGQVYRGSFHNNKKQGEGEMYYKYGSHYQGDWVLDQRQGHGIMQYADGSLYEGQWRNDLFNGQGSMIHCSGVIYDGIWINGRPADLLQLHRLRSDNTWKTASLVYFPKEEHTYLGGFATKDHAIDALDEERLNRIAEASKLVILGEEIREVVEGCPFSVEVQLQNNKGEIVKAESGRVLQILAGVKHVKLSPNVSDTFLEQEDLEESLFETPFGYTAINYPLMAYVPEPDKAVNSAEPSRSDVTTVGSLSIKDTSVNETKLDFLPITGNIHGSLQGSQFTPAVEKESSVPPNQRTENGYAVFCNIAFALPDNYQPLDELEKKTSKRLSSRTTVSQEKISESRSEVSIKLSGKSKKKQNVTDPQIVKPGDYVIMVKDVTTPPFLDRTLPPAFILLKVKPHKASKKSSRKEHQKVSNK